MDVKPERWQRIDSLLDGALDRVPADRAAFLDQACGHDRVLRNEVQSLLASAEQHDLLDRPLFRHHMEEPIIGRRIGPYKIISLLGWGGMGAVYLAKREEDFETRVALKLIRRGMDTAEIVRRFRDERQILANLNHPNIARILDGGTTEDGAPYFAMEYVEGEPIHRYCDLHELSISHRLELFLKVCAAVQLSHQNLVVHRDLKPGNILVTAEGTPKLLDFGIARWLARGSAALKPAIALSERPMTLEYASPEQIRGGAVTTTSDIYSLGVLLYKLLSGHHPYRLESRSREALRQAIREQEPAKPSTAVERQEEIRRSDGNVEHLTPEDVSWTRSTAPDKLRRQIAGDLDSIVLMAMRKEPLQRYGSVEQLSRDIRCHLERRPVLARNRTFLYRSGKFLRRHPWPLAAAVASSLLLSSFVVATTVFWRQAVRDQKQTGETLDLLEEIFQLSDPGETLTLRQVLDRGTTRIREHLASQRLERAKLMLIMGNVYRSLGEYDTAELLLGDSLETRREALGSHHLLVGESKNDLALLLWQRENYAEAESLLEEALELYRKGFAEDHDDLAKITNNLALLKKALGKREAAESLYREALDMKTRLHGEASVEVAITLSNLASLYDGWYDDRAEALYRQALRMRRDLLDSGHPDLATSLYKLGIFLYGMGSYRQAEPLLREAVEKRKAIFGDQRQVVDSLMGLAACAWKLEDYREAEELYGEVVETLRRRLPDGHLEVATARRLLGLSLDQQGKDCVEPAELALKAFHQSEPKGVPGAEELLKKCQERRAAMAGVDQ